jgi:ABC-type sugar transport system substrate-binding protein
VHPSRPARRTWSAAIVAITLLVASGALVTAQSPSASAAPSASQVPATSAPSAPPAATSAPSPTAPANPYADAGAAEGSGAGKRIGYISFGDSVAFVKAVSDGIADQAAIAGVDLVTCDAKASEPDARACADRMRLEGVAGVLSFQPFEALSAELCAAYGGLPTIAIDIHQHPCERVFVGADDGRAGFVAGEAVGAALRAENGCTYGSVITVEAPGAGAVSERRATGMLDGFRSACGEVPADRIIRIDGGGTTDLALEAVNGLFPSITSTDPLVLLSVSDDMAFGALAAARAAGREPQLRIGAHGADASARREIACNAAWVADAAYFPERYGRTLIPAMIDLLDGKEVPAELFTVHEAVTGANVRTLYPDTPDCA